MDRAWHLLVVVALAACSETPPPAAPSASAAAPPHPSPAAKNEKDPVESVGGLSLGLAPSGIVAILGEPKSKAPPSEEGASGLWLSEWAWPAVGVAVTMEVEKATGAARSTHFIDVRPPSKLKTPAGIGVGSTRAEVVAAYGAKLDKASATDTSLYVGTVYGGMLFGLDAGRVVRIAIGAFAE